MNARCPATFTHPLWIRAISAQLGGALLLQEPATGLPMLQTTLRKTRWPVLHYETWLTPLTNSGLPAAPKMPTPQHVLALLEGAEAPVVLNNMPLDHPVTQALLDVPGHVRVLRTWERAVLPLEGSFDQWMDDNFDHKRRKELKRLRARLAEQGDLQIKTLQANDAVEPFHAAFLHLESQGWKGARGTAIASDAKAARALLAGLVAMHAANKLCFWQMNLDGKPIASLFSLVDDGEAALGKIAHDEAFARFSPGVLIVLEATKALFEMPDLHLADSNAMPDHPMINRIWRGRRACADLLVAGPNVPTAVLQLLATWLGTKDAAKSVIKRVLAQTTGRKQS